MLTEESISLSHTVTAATALISKWTESPIEPTTSIMDSAWNGAGMLQFPKGWVYAKNDARFLYLVLDVIADTGTILVPVIITG